MTARDASIIAWHEAGHALVAARLGLPVFSIEVGRWQGSVELGGAAMSAPPSHCVAHIAAGLLAEAIRDQRRTVDWTHARVASDLQLLAHYGIELSADGSFASPLYAEGSAIAWRILRAEEPLLDELATRLGVFGRMSGAQLTSLLDKHDQAALASLEARIEARVAEKIAERAAFRRSPLGRSYEADNLKAWQQAGRPGDHSRYALDHWNHEISHTDADGRRRAIWQPPHRL